MLFFKGSPPGLSASAPDILHAARRMAMFYLDVTKDVALILVLRHVSDYILINRFDTVGGINLDYLQ